MASVLSPNPHDVQNIVPKPITSSNDAESSTTTGTAIPTSTGTAIPTPSVGRGARSGHLNLDTFSPVNQNGSFAFDRVIKSGEVNKRTRKTKQWKVFFLVLRPNLLSIYKNESEARLHKQISLSDLTAVAFLKDPKGRRENVFGLFSPAKNFHFQAKSREDAQSWVDLIRREARIDEQQTQEILLASPTMASHDAFTSHQETSTTHEPWPPDPPHPHDDRLGSSSPEPTTRDGIRIPGVGIRRPSAPSLDYSGDELSGPYASDFSEYQTPSSSYQPPSSFGSFVPRKQRSQQQAPNAPLHQHHQTPYAHGHPNSSSTHRQISTATRNFSQISISGASHTGCDGPDASSSSEKVIWQGPLLLLRTNRAGVKQWRKLWAVLRSKNLAFYKTEEEYAAVLILPLANCVDAVEIDAVSKSKRFCMQIIMEDKGYRFCAESEDRLAEWLGALKMVVSWRREREREKEREKEGGVAVAR